MTNEESIFQLFIVSGQLCECNLLCALLENMSLGFQQYSFGDKNAKKQIVCEILEASRPFGVSVITGSAELFYF